MDDHNCSDLEMVMAVPVVRGQSSTRCMFLCFILNGGGREREREREKEEGRRERALIGRLILYRILL